MTSRKKSPNTRQDSQRRPCVFLDRDGTVTHEVGYVNHPERLRLLGGAAGAIRRLNRAGVLVVLVSNQAGVARGYFSEEVLQATMARLEKLLTERGARLDAIYYSPYHPDSPQKRWRNDPDEFRKPGLGMIRKARAELAIDMNRAFMIGDRYSDIIFAHRAGLPGVFVKTGYGLGEFTYKRREWTEQPDYIAEGLPQAVGWVLRELKKKPRID